MKHLGIITILAALALAASTTYAADTTDAPKAEKPSKKDRAAKGDKGKAGLKGEYGMMASELNLSADQQAKIKAIVEKGQEAQAAWDKENGPKAAELKKKISETTDKAEKKKLDAELKELNKGPEKLKADQKTAVMDALTPAQRAQWRGFMLNRAQLSMLGRANITPTEDQKTKIKDLCVAATKNLTDPAAELDKAATIKVANDIKANVLTAEQRDQMEKAAPAGKEKKGKGEGKKGGKNKDTAEPADNQ